MGKGKNKLKGPEQARGRVAWLHGLAGDSKELALPWK